MPWQIAPGAISAPGQRTGADRIKAILRGLARIPVTLLIVGLLFLAGVLTGALFAPADPTDSAITSLEFGLPAFREGRVWTLFTGAVTFTEPEFYLFVGAVLAVGLGLYERRVGSLRALLALVVTHTAGIVIPALLLWPFVNSNWTWASTLAGELDAGMSAGGFGVAAAATALLRPPWRGRIRVLVTSFLTVLVFKSGLLWDLEHLVGWGAGLVIGPWLAQPALRARGRAPEQPGRPPGAAEARMLTALIAAGFAVSTVVAVLYPGLGGIIGPNVGGAQVRGFWLIILELVIALLVCGALPRPLALGWWVAVVGVAAIIVNSLVNTPVQPRIGDAVCSAIVLAVLVVNHRSWPWRTDGSVLRPVAVLVGIMIAVVVATSVVVWVVREQFRPVPDLLLVTRTGLARLTFTTGPVVPRGFGGRAVVVGAGVAWALMLIGWLVWALYVRTPGGWRGALAAIRTGREPEASEA